MRSLRVISHLFRKELIQVRRDHQLRGMILGMPIVMTLLLGYAITRDVRDLPLGVLDYDSSVESRHLVESFRHNETFAVECNLNGPEDLRASLDAGTIAAALVIPARFSTDLARGSASEVQIILDGVDSNASLIAAAHARGIVQSFALAQVRKRLAGRDLPDLLPRVQVLYNPELVSRIYMVPGVVVVLLTMLTSLMTGLGLVRERESGTLEQLSVTPIRTVELILGKVLPFVGIAFFVLTFAIGICIVWFRVPLHGSIPLLVLFAFIFLFNTLGLGILVSTIARNQQQALFMIWFVLIFGIIMSGLFFPIENMTEEMQLLTLLNPIRYFLTVVRELFLKGSGMATFGTELTGLLTLGPLALMFAGLRFSKRVK